MLNALVASAGLPGAKVTAAQLSGYKNYFIGKAVGHSSIHQLYYALKGLKSQKQQVFLEAASGFEYVMGDGSQKTLKYQIKDAFGNPSVLSNITKATIKQLKSNSSAIDVTSMVKLHNNEIAVELSNILNLNWASYSINFVAQSGSTTSLQVRKTFQVKVQIFKETGISFSQTEDWNPPTSYQVTSFPTKFKAKNTNEYPIIHMQIDTAFFGDSEKMDYPRTVFVTLKKKGQLPYSGHADYVSNIQRHQIAIDLRYMIQE